MKKRTWIVAIIVLLLIIVAGSMVTQTKDSPETPEEAIRQAQQYRPKGGCTQVMTPATHTATGAKLTFSSGCLPPGWEADL